MDKYDEDVLVKTVDAISESVLAGRNEVHSQFEYLKKELKEIRALLETKERTPISFEQMQELYGIANRE